MSNSDHISSHDKPHIILDVLYWAFFILSMGTWLCVENDILMPWSNTAKGLQHWRWTWFSYARIPAFAVVASPLLCGLVVTLFAFVAHFVTSRLVKYLFRNKSIKTATQCFHDIRFFGLVFGIIFLLAILAQFITASPAWGVAMWVAVIAVGRIACLAIFWSALHVRPLLDLVVPFLSRHIRVFFALAVAAIVISLSFHIIKLTGDEPSYIFMAGSLRNDQNLQIDSDELALFNRMAQLPQTHRAHQITIDRGNNDLIEVPWHYAGPAILILPAYLIGEFSKLPLQIPLRFYMLIFFILWMYAAFYLSRRLTGWPVSAAVATLIVAVSCPMLGTSMSVFPDNIAGYIILAAFCFGADVLSGKSKRLTLKQTVFIIVLASLLPWLHIKYALLSVVLGLFVLCYSPRPTARAIIVSCGVLVFCVLIFAFYYLKTYGLNIIGEPSEAATGNGYLGILFDADSGLIAYAPWVILLPVGCAMLANYAGTKAYTIFFALIFLAVYLPTVNTPFWGSPGSPVLRYLCPAIALTPPILAAAMSSLKYRPFVIFVLCLIPLLGFKAYAHDPWQVYGAGLQTGRTLLDNCVGAFAWSEFFPFFNYSARKLNDTHAILQSILIALFLITLTVKLTRLHRNKFACVAWLMIAPFVLIVIATICGSPNRTLNASKLFSKQTKQLALMGKYRNIKLTADGPQASLCLPFAVKPFNTEGYRTLTDDNGLDLDFRRPKGTFATMTTMRLWSGTYRFAIEGRAKNTCETTASIRLKILRTPDYKPFVSFDMSLAPATQTSQTLDLLSKEFTFSSPERLKLIFAADDGPDVIVKNARIDYLGASAAR